MSSGTVDASVKSFRYSWVSVWGRSILSGIFIFNFSRALVKIIKKT